jgi:hypothetical protein
MSEWSRATVDKYWAGMHVVPEGEPWGFRMRGCDSCRTGLGGDRYTVLCQLPGESTWERDAVCPDCLHYLANGEVPDGCEG